MGRADRRMILKQSMAEVSRGGMDLRASSSDQSWAVIAETRILIDIFNGHAPTRASKAAEKAHEFFETSLKRNASGIKIDCKMGCAFCCHVAVSALAPEVFLIANTIRARHVSDLGSRVAGIRAAAQATHRMSVFERARRRLPCALLENNMCSVYSARPGPCRGVTSTSVEVCERAFNGANAVIPTPVVWDTLRNAELQAMMAALTAVELPSESYELNEAICVALDDPNAESRWLRGQDVFAGVARLHMGIDNPAIIENNRRVIAQLVAGALGKEMPGTG
jgi:hypothetical protein